MKDLTKKYIMKCTIFNELNCCIFCCANRFLTCTNSDSVEAQLDSLTVGQLDCSYSLTVWKLDSFTVWQFDSLTVKQFDSLLV